MDRYEIGSFYRFVSLSSERVVQLIDMLQHHASAQGVLGLVVIGHEGINATVAGSSAGLASFRSQIDAQPEFANLLWKRSSATRAPFRRFRVDRRDEIVTLKSEVAWPDEGDESHLSPSEWHQRMNSHPEAVVIDTRNWYETDLGLFENAVDFRLKRFSDFPECVAKSGIAKDKEILMYCTGGIRCEKAALEMRKQGFDKVYQLKGGILKYLEEFPEGKFSGECFVFDHRVAVDSKLQPSTRYQLCAHCGDPARTKIACHNCHEEAAVCDACLEHFDRNSCSKNCSYHLRRKKTSPSAAQPQRVGGSAL